MSTLSVSYKDLHDAANEADRVARKLDNYADALEKQIYNKLNKYSGEWTSNIATAYSQVNQKVVSLENDAITYGDYADDLNKLEETCEIVDGNVAKKVFSLTAEFKENHDIANNVVINTIAFFLTKRRNSTAFGRWVDDQMVDTTRETLRSAQDKIKTWWNYEGGKQAVKGIIVAGLEIAIGVCAVVGAIASIVATGGASIVVIASLISGVITAVNGFANLVNEGRALYYNMSEENCDPAWARRLSNENTLQDIFRKELGSSAKGIKILGVLAGVIDFAEIACTTVTFLSGLGKLAKNGYKWATTSSDALKDIKLSDVFKKDNGKHFLNRISNEWTDLKRTLKMNGLKGWGKTFVDRVKSDWWSNFKDEFLNFKEVKDWNDMKDVMGSTKSILEVVKGVVEGGINVNNILSTGVSDIVLPCISVFHVNNIENGKLKIDSIPFGDFSDIWDKGVEIIEYNVLGEIGPIENRIIGKLSEYSDITISVPDNLSVELIVPDINIFNVNIADINIPAIG